MLGGRDRNEPWHQSKRHDIYKYRFSKLRIENEEEVNPFGVYYTMKQE